MAAVRRHEIAEAILIKIITHELRPGESIPEEALAEEFQVSRTPIREALSALEYRGFVIAEPGKGHRALSKSADGIRDFFDAAGPIYDATYRLAAVLRSDDLLARLAQRLEEILALTEADAPFARVLCCRAFMADFASGSNNPFLTDATVRLIDFHIFLQSGVAASLSAKELADWMREDWRHHSEILRHARASDAGGMADSITRWLSNSQVFLISHFFGNSLMAANRA